MKCTEESRFRLVVLPPRLLFSRRQFHAILDQFAGKKSSRSGSVSRAVCSAQNWLRLHSPRLPRSHRHRHIRGMSATRPAAISSRSVLGFLTTPLRGNGA
jgi:hypothetical protein